MRKIAYYLSLILIFSVPWENAITVAQFGTLTRSIGALTAVVCAGATLEIGFRKPHLYHGFLFAFVAWNIASYFWSLDVEVTLVRIKTYLQLIILSWILWELYTEVKHLNAALQAYIVGGYVVIASTIWNYVLEHTISEYEFGRFAGAGLNAVDQALILALGIPIAWNLALSGNLVQKKIIFGLINYAYIPISLFAIALTGSRTGFLVCIPAVLYILFTAGRNWNISRIYIYWVLFGATMFAVYQIPAKTTERLATVSESITNADLGGRVSLWEASIKAFSRYPLLGIGSGSLMKDTELNEVAHNSFLSVLSELGLIGISLFISILIIVIFQIFYQSYPGNILWAVVFLLWIMGAATLTWEYRKPTWLVLNLIIVSANVWEQG